MDGWMKRRREEGGRQRKDKKGKAKTLEEEGKRGLVQFQLNYN